MSITVRQRLWIYGAVFAVLLVVWPATPSFSRPKVYSIPSSKVAAYLAAKSSYKLLAVGDSRTYTDIQPRGIAPLTGRQTYNMASFGLWMPVQYLEFRDVFPHVPSDTVIVWSLSHYNFVPIGDQWWIPGQYAFGVADIVEYVNDGYPVKRALREYEESPFSAVDSLVRLRKRLAESLEYVVWKRQTRAFEPVNRTFEIPGAGPKLGLLPVARSTAADESKALAEKMEDRLKVDADVTLVHPLAKDGVINSIETTRTDGGYDRIVIDPNFFREQQSKMWPPHSDAGHVCDFDANPVYMRTFYKILNLISAYRLHVIVNYIEDAPGSWPSESDRRCAKQFVVTKIVPILKERGIAFTAPDLYQAIDSSNDFYFDNSHLNSEGAAIYSRILAGEINEVLKAKGW